MKKCYKCGKQKQLTEFYPHKGNRDGRLGQCKECSKAYSIRWRQENIEKVREHDRQRGARQSPEYLADYRKKYPNKYRATNMVNNAIRDGKLFREPCEYCGNTKTHAHHDDYAKPLNVRWLCASCHSCWHQEYGEAANP